METKTIDALVQEYSECGSASPDAELRMVDAALFVEDCFGVRLADDEITAGNLGGPEAIRGFLRGKIGK